MALIISADIFLSAIAFIAPYGTLVPAVPNIWWSASAYSIDWEYSFSSDTLSAPIFSLFLAKYFSDKSSAASNPLEISPANPDASFLTSGLVRSFTSIPFSLIDFNISVIILTLSFVSSANLALNSSFDSSNSEELL